MKKRYILTATIATAFLALTTGCGNGKDISQDEAKKIAFENAGVSESDTTRLSVSKEKDDGKTVYEIRFDIAEKEYDYEINAENGDILSSDIETDENYNNSQQTQNNTSENGTTNQNTETNQTNNANTGNTTTSNQTTQNTNVKISEADAKKAALSKVPGATEADLKMELEYDDGKYIYEGDIIHEQTEYEFEIDANTGTFLKWSKENL